MDDNVKEPTDFPTGKRKKREKVAKERVHIYISDDSLHRIDTKAKELGLDRSPCIQMLINFALNNLKTIPIMNPAPGNALGQQG